MPEAEVLELELQSLLKCPVSTSSFLGTTDQRRRACHLKATDELFLMYLCSHITDKECDRVTSELSIYLNAMGCPDLGIRFTDSKIALDA